MSRTWLIDGKAFNSARWRTFIHKSLKDMQVFLSDLNATLNDDGTINVYGIEEASGRHGVQEVDSYYLVDEHDPLYQTNRGAAVNRTLAPDGYDQLVLDTFKLPEGERIAKFDKLYAEAVQGYGGSLQDSWNMIPDSSKLVYTLHLWERLRKGKLPPEMWAAALHLSWPHGKVGSMMFRANLSESEVIRMFEVAPKFPLMPEEDIEVLLKLPREVTAWRGVSSLSRYQQRGFSWTLDRDRAEWFAYANVSSGEAIVLEGRFRRDAILMYSDFEEELVINPRVSPLSVVRNALDMSRKSKRLDKLRRLLERKDDAAIAAEARL